MKLLDGIKNALTGLGGGNDPGAQSRHYFQPLTDQQLLTMYNASWLARQVVDIPADDATKKWRAWKGEDAGATQAIKDLEKEWQVQAKINLSMSRARLLGGAAVLIGAGSANASEPLRIDDVQSLEYLTVLDRIDLASDQEERDPTSIRFGRPKSYRMAVNGSLQTIHPSRLVIFDGLDAGARVNGTNLYGWGHSRLQPCAEAITGYDSAMQSLKNLMHQAKTDVIGIEGLTQRIQDPVFEKSLKARLAILEATLGNNRKIIMDNAETYQVSSYAFGGVAEVIDRFATQVAGASDIPMTRLFGQSPGGLNSTGDADLTNYYDQIAAIQKNDIAPAMRLFDQVLIKVAGVEEGSVSPTWNPVKEMTEAQEADILGKKAEAFAKLVGTQIFDEDTLAEAGAQLLSSSGLEGLAVSEEGF